MRSRCSALQILLNEEIASLESQCVSLQAHFSELQAAELRSDGYRKIQWDHVFGTKAY